MPTLKQVGAIPYLVISMPALLDAQQLAANLLLLQQVHPLARYPPIDMHAGHD